MPPWPKKHIGTWVVNITIDIQEHYYESFCHAPTL